MQEIITIDMLTADSVSIKRQKSVMVGDITYPVDEPSRKAYVNSTVGRVEIAEELSEPYLSAVMAVWGDTPTVVPTED